MRRPQKIIISRTDSIGDVLLTLPITGALKAKFPDSRLVFLGRTYTENIIRCCTHIDDFINLDAASNTADLAKLLKRQEADCMGQNCSLCA